VSIKQLCIKMSRRPSVLAVVKGTSLLRMSSKIDTEKINAISVYVGSRQILVDVISGRAKKELFRKGSNFQPLDNLIG
jgi:hypothetical protein